MTREEAIKYFESLLKRFEEMYETETSYWGKAHAETTIEATRLALTALRPVSRERVEKMWKGEWHRHYKSGTHAGNGVVCSKCDMWNNRGAHFCPSCGAPMTDEAVEMVMERLEALHEITE